ncbi:MAG: hypothetical protein O2815_11815 [Actinomycetota bacterium]|nr:hypothetical protein [Actinomycetota bacterium]
MEEKTKENLKKGAKATAHGLGDIAEVAGHIVAGTVKGAADGIESVSAHRKEQKKDDD